MLLSYRALGSVREGTTSGGGGVNPTLIVPASECLLIELIELSLLVRMYESWRLADSTGLVTAARLKGGPKSPLRRGRCGGVVKGVGI